MKSPCKIRISSMSFCGHRAGSSTHVENAKKEKVCWQTFLVTPVESVTWEATTALKKGHADCSGGLSIAHKSGTLLKKGKQKESERRESEVHSAIPKDDSHTAGTAGPSSDILQGAEIQIVLNAVLSGSRHQPWDGHSWGVVVQAVTHSRPVNNENGQQYLQIECLSNHLSRGFANDYWNVHRVCIILLRQHWVPRPKESVRES